MKTLIKLEEAAQFGICLFYLVAALQVPWWCCLLLLIGPDIGMIGYLLSPKAGAVTYNLLHHKGVALLLILAATMSHLTTITTTPTALETNTLITGVILYGHASMDRIFGYGLKFGDSFQHTHLGWIGRLKGQEQGQEAGNAR